METVKVVYLTKRQIGLLLTGLQEIENQFVAMRDDQDILDIREAREELESASK